MDRRSDKWATRTSVDVSVPRLAGFFPDLIIHHSQPTARTHELVWCTPGSGRSSENVTILRGFASVPLRRALGGATPLAAATADSGASSLNMEATLGRVKDGLIRARGAPDGGRCSTKPNEPAPAPVHASSLYCETRQVCGPHGQPPSWLLPAHYPGCSWPLSRPERHGCHSTSQSSPTTEVTARAHIARARLGLVTKRCLEVPPECMQGGSLWP